MYVSCSSMILHTDPINRFLICCPSSDVSHLTPPMPSPSPSIPSTGPTKPVTNAPSDVCLNVQCLNDGVCVADEGKAACRCVWGVGGYDMQQRSPAGIEPGNGCNHVARAFNYLFAKDDTTSISTFNKWFIIHYNVVVSRYKVL